MIVERSSDDIVVVTIRSVGRRFRRRVLLHVAFRSEAFLAAQASNVISPVAIGAFFVDPLFARHGRPSRGPFSLSAWLARRISRPALVRVVCDPNGAYRRAYGV